MKEQENMKERKEISPEEMDKASGGTFFEAANYVMELGEKYQPKDPKNLGKMVTQAERDYADYLFQHKEGEPLRARPE